jgi:glucosylceramidase
VVEGVEQVAFRNPDGSRVLLLANWNESAQRLGVRVGGRAFTTTLPARSVATYGWR